jgi:hypothetical protein
MAILVLVLAPALASYGIQGAGAVPEMNSTMATGDAAPGACKFCQEQTIIDVSACALICGAITAILPLNPAADLAAVNVFPFEGAASGTALSLAPEPSPPRDPTWS